MMLFHVSIFFNYVHGLRQAGESIIPITILTHADGFTENLRNQILCNQERVKHTDVPTITI